MLINGVPVSDDIILPLRESTTPAVWDYFWTAVSNNLKDRIVATADDKLSELKTKVSHVEELRGLFREILSGKK